ncbi:hypothetical protein FEE95_15115 [Maribacter algarum]|uniref:Uncharacterized protein n=1 Tax=Maribacter algarum (ex Zhang et al. 2020) TaxID=2578118 RepID=A0A5S3PNN3_9FLAO|nr:hypothetical protein [Maribacter algarum]TMM55971.1 hypothetical protein FEE95_15115 [Maribacter algarum]
MKRAFLLLLFFLFSAVIYSQSLLQAATKNRSNLVAKEPVKIYLDNYKFKAREFYGYLGFLETDFSKNDTTELKELITKAMDSEPDLTKWTEKEIPNKILVEPDKFVKPKIGLEKIKWTTKEEKKAIIKEIRKYNRMKVMWPSFPLYLSRPVYSKSGNYALIGLVNGGSTGAVILYKKKDEKWTEVADLKSWVY